MNASLHRDFILSVRGRPDAINVAGDLADCASMIKLHAWDIPNAPRPADELAALAKAERAALRAIEIIQARRWEIG